MPEPTPDPTRIEQTFAEALGKPTPAERAAFLEAACAGDAQLRARVEHLLAAHADAANALPLPTLGADMPVESAGVTIGRYKLLEQIGEGGFGVVFMAEQTAPVHRRVALKVIKLGMDTRQVVARFEAERQALAMMDHPHVARVYDGGATDAGRPYFVMELVKGVPITEYCDKHNLSIARRLELFTQVCQAVQHAHQKGIIHRDLKPTNVLVATADDRPVAKVIDFGVAKATQARLTERTLFTEFRQWVGTPQYMSPEQADGAVDVDTRSDVYALGVLLYELLTGTTPFEARELREKGYAEIQRIICEVEPPRPSTRLSTMRDLPSVAATRHTEPRRLQNLVRGELDWIVMKCLEKDRTRRYETASALADDLQRHLTEQPVTAIPPSTCYRLRKFVRRNRSGLTVGALLLVGLTTVIGGGGWLVRDRAARRAALEQSVGRLVEESQQWQRQGKWSDALVPVERAEALVANGDGGADMERRVRDRLDDLRMLARLDDIRGLCESGEELADFTRGDADRAYALAFREFGIDVDATDPQSSAGRIRGRSVALELAAALDHWALVRAWQGLDSEAQRLLTVARLVDDDAWRNRLRAVLLSAEKQPLLDLAAVAPPHDLLPATLVLVATTLESTGQREAAFALLSEAQRRHPDDFWINWRLASCASLLDRRGDAVTFYTVAASLRPNRPEVYTRLGGALGIDMRLDEGIAKINEAVRIRPDYPRAYFALTWLLATYPDAAQRRPAQAVEYARVALKLRPDHPNSWANFGVASYAAGDWRQAVEALENADKIMGGRDHFHRFHLAMARWRVGDEPAARLAFQQGVEWMEQKHPPYRRELLRFRAEAAELLGLPPAPMTATPSEPDARPSSAATRPAR